MDPHPLWWEKMNSLLDLFEFDGYWHRYSTSKIAIKVSIGDVFYIEAKQDGRQYVFCDDDLGKATNVLANLIRYESI